jgi:hypothetical protein
MNAVVLLAPILFEVDISTIVVALIGLESFLLQNFNNTFRLGVRIFTGFPVFLRHANHGRISTQENMGGCRIQFGSQLGFEFPTSD